MKARQFLAAAMLGMAAFAAHAGVYTYTGNTFDFDVVDATPSHIVATFDFDFANSPSASWDTYNFNSWDVQAGSVHLSSAHGDVLSNRFSFDADKNITGWFFNAGTVSGDYADGNIQSLSADYSFFAPNPASDIVLIGNPLKSASIYGKQGTWTGPNAVPEPASLLLLGIGGAAWAGLHRRRQRTV